MAWLPKRKYVYATAFTLAGISWAWNRQDEHWLRNTYKDKHEIMLRLYNDGKDGILQAFPKRPSDEKENNKQQAPKSIVHVLRTAYEEGQDSAPQNNTTKTETPKERSDRIWTEFEKRRAGVPDQTSEIIAQWPPELYKQWKEFKLKTDPGDYDKLRQEHMRLEELKKNPPKPRPDVDPRTVDPSTKQKPKNRLNQDPYHAPLLGPVIEN